MGRLVYASWWCRAPRRRPHTRGKGAAACPWEAGFHERPPVRAWAPLRRHSGGGDFSFPPPAPASLHKNLAFLGFRAKFTFPGGESARSTPRWPPTVGGFRASHPRFVAVPCAAARARSRVPHLFWAIVPARAVALARPAARARKRVPHLVWVIAPARAVAAYPCGPSLSETAVARGGAAPPP